MAFLGIVNARSGQPAEHRERPRQRVQRHRYQRPNKVSDDFYTKSLTSYFNRDAFAQPAAGTLGDLPRNAVVGPAFGTSISPYRD